MPLLEKIVDHINASIKSSLSTKELQNNQLQGIADKCFGDTPEEGQAVEIRPFIFDNNGIGKVVEYDDRINVSAYHRILSNQYQDDPAVMRGNDKGRTCVSEMLMVVCANRKRLQASPTELESLIESVFPSSIPKSLGSELSLYRCTITILAATFDQMQVFATEYSNVPFFIKPHQAYFSVRYRIQSSFLPGCFNKCCDK